MPMPSMPATTYRIAAASIAPESMKKNAEIAPAWKPVIAIVVIAFSPRWYFRPYINPLSFFVRHRLFLVQVNERAFLVANDDIGQAVAIDVAGDDLGADSGVIVDEKRDEVDAAVGIAHELEPIQDGRVVAIRIARAS